MVFAPGHPQLLVLNLTDTHAQGDNWTHSGIIKELAFIHQFLCDQHAGHVTAVSTCIGASL